MWDNYIRETIEKGQPLTLVNAKGEIFLYFDKFRMLLPNQQYKLKKEYDIDTLMEDMIVELNGMPLVRTLIKAHHACEIFSYLNRVPEMKAWNLNTSLWFVDNRELYDIRLPKQNIVYDGRTERIEELTGNRKARILQVIYLQGRHVLENNKVQFNELEIYGLRMLDRQLDYVNYNDTSEKSTAKFEEPIVKSEEHVVEFEEPIAKSEKAIFNFQPDNRAVETESDYIQKLLDSDKIRCGLASYQKEMLYDIKAGHWDVFESENKDEIDERLVSRDPRVDVRKNGVIGIDFGTKSTVVMKQEGSNEIRPIRIGSLSLDAEVLDKDYENPTIISCIDIDKFLSEYMASAGRPKTSCNDLFISYNAYNDYINCPTENFYAYYSDLKQWANLEKENAVVQDIKGRKKYRLSAENSIEKMCINPIEIYAYYIGMYINNMRNGIYLKYIMSFPVKYSKYTKELIRKSFENGLKKSLPRTIVEDDEIMSGFSVKYEISEPAAYAVTALEQSGFKPKDENEKYLYGIFDFGGGTTDFDFGIWRGASDDEYDLYNCDYVLECFGADSDVRLGGENILEMLAYNVFKDNKEMASEKKIACALPVDQTPFLGGEYLLNNSQSANRNLTLLKEALRPLWEQHDNWKEKYCKYKKTDSKLNDFQNEKEFMKMHLDNMLNDSQNEEELMKMHLGSMLNDFDDEEEFINIQMYDFSGKAVPDCKFIIDTQKLIELIKQRINKGVEAFFECMEKTILGNKSAQTASEKIYIFLAGNSCRSVFVREIFEKMIEKYNNDYAKYGEKEQDRFELIFPLNEYTKDYKYIPNMKTSVAYGLIKSRPGGKIYVKKNYETSLSEETVFKYYLGTDRRGLFECKLSPMMLDENGESRTSYNVWIKFQGAGMGVARIYYTEIPGADSKVNKLDIDDIPFHEIDFESEKGKYLFIKAVDPSTIVYTTADSEDDIDEDNVKELNIDRF